MYVKDTRLVIYLASLLNALCWFAMQITPHEFFTWISLFVESYLGLNICYFFLSVLRIYPMKSKQ